MKTNPKKHYKNPELKGIISISHRGFGVVKIGDKDEVVHIEHSFLHTACHGDEVRIKLHPKNFGEEEKGEVIEILRRAKKGYSGILESEKDVYFLAPSDLRMYADIIIPKNKLNRATVGQKVFVEITDWSDSKKPPVGKITKILGKPMEHNAEMEAIALEKGFDSHFPQEVEKEAKKISHKGIVYNDFENRRDQRNITTFTIDPEEAKDFDDALSIRKINKDIYEVGIHIADVSHYVKLNSELDKEARARGTSVYLVDRTIPMLPEELSNDLCSLNEGVDRLTFSAIFNLDINGTIHKEWFGKTVINSNKRFTYEKAQKILDDGKGEFFEELKILNKIAKRLHKKRFAEGAISLDKDEVKFKLDKDGKPISIYIKERGDTNKMIEEFMLLANRHVAEFMAHPKGNKSSVFLYRIHDKPNMEKMKDLSIYLKRLGYHVRLVNGVIPGEEINSLVLKLEDSPIRDTINSAIIRTMAKAIYSTKNIGHYGLGFKFYTHFTSPIRRYPDIIVHRLLNDSLLGNTIPKERWYEYEEMSIEASNREREAAEAERASLKYKQVEYMSNRIGKKFEGVITGVTEWGLYAEENKTKCEGMIHIRDLKDDYYTFDKKNMSIKGKKTHKKYTLGDKVKFIVKSADMNRKTIDYKLIDEKQNEN